LKVIRRSQLRNDVSLERFIRSLSFEAAVGGGGELGDALGAGFRVEL